MIEYVKEIRSIKTNEVIGYKVKIKDYERLITIPITNLDTINEIEDEEPNELLKEVVEWLNNNAALPDDEYLDRYRKYVRIEINKIRDELFEKLTVSYTIGETEYVFDGDEISQDRINRAINVLDDNEDIEWITANDERVIVNKKILRNILKLIGTRQYELTLMFNDLKAMLPTADYERLKEILETTKNIV